MPLRLIEMVLPEKDRESLEKLLTRNDLPILGIWTEPMLGIWERPVGGVWKKSFTEPQILVKILVSTTEAESVIDLLEKRFHRREGCRLVVLPVAASLPRPELAEDGGEAKAQPGEKTKKKSKRIGREELYADVASVEVSGMYVFMVVLSSIVAAIGVMKNNVAVIIGAMVIAPLLLPNVSFSLATILGDRGLAERALKANIVGIGTAVVISYLLGSLLPVDPQTPEIASRTAAGLGDVVLALASGSAGALAFTTGVSATLIGVMVAVALLPPLVTFGLLMGSGHESLAWGAMLLFVANFISVNLSGVATFLAQGIRPTGWRQAKMAKRTSIMAMALWVLMLAVLLAIILRWQPISI
ncbi:MAG TPA: TIGR00341 family protein [Methanothrix sp.]|nr:TIGR00341 family protein [Methanothrix sp.]HRW82773.1 TIGR00341 family protein [Methanothrix sp.]